MAVCQSFSFSRIHQLWGQIGCSVYSLARFSRCLTSGESLTLALPPIVSVVVLSTSDAPTASRPSFALSISSFSICSLSDSFARSTFCSTGWVPDVLVLSAPGRTSLDSVSTAWHSSCVGVGGASDPSGPGLPPTEGVSDVVGDGGSSIDRFVARTSDGLFQRQWDRASILGRQGKVDASIHLSMASTPIPSGSIQDLSPLSKGWFTKREGTTPCRSIPPHTNTNTWTQTHRDLDTQTYRHTLVCLCESQGVDDSRVTTHHNELATRRSNGTA